VRSALFAGVLLLLLSGEGRAQSSSGAEVFEFLGSDADARAVGLGGAYTALAADANALQYNPAGLGFIKQHEVSFMHNQRSEGIAQEYMGAAFKSGVGLQLNRVSIGSVRRTTLSAPDGTGATFGAAETALAAGYGREVGDWVTLGAAVKYYNASLDDVSAHGYGVDLGTLWRFRRVPGLAFGLSVLNYGPAMRYQYKDENLPMTGRVGGAYEFKRANLRHLLAVDLSRTRYGSAVSAVGWETVLPQGLAVRAGWSERADSGIGISVGAGFLGKAWRADYAFTPLGALGVSHRLSVALRWGMISDGLADKETRAEANLVKAEAALKAGDRATAKELLAAGLMLLPEGHPRRARFEQLLKEAWR
jgi:hypothetical protein